MYFYSGRIPELIRLNSRGGGILQSNCIRCHETTVMLTDNERRCWSCHRRIAHLHTGTIETY
jgi:cytochrome c nitrite reductase small subunit